MSKILIFSASNDFSAIEVALAEHKAGNDVTFLQCDNSLELCQHNRFGNPLMCAHCSRSMKGVLDRMGIPKIAHVLMLKDIITEEDKNEATGFQPEYNTVAELKGVKYHNASVGYGAFSSYVTFSRNVMPDFTPEFKKYINFLIRKEVMTYHALERLHEKESFDKIVLHNARFAQFKPFYEFAVNHSLEYVCTEHNRVGGKLLKNNFINDIPHSIFALTENVKTNWEKGDPATRESIGRSFYEKRRNGIVAGDVVYTKAQRKGELPEDWDENKENIAIFNSSEDEFCAVSKDYDSYLLFPYQYDALKAIFEHYKNDSNKHFYLRIHPNLNSVPFKSHLALYELKYDNVTIIPGNSSISSYSLMDSCLKVIIFNSTMGPESSYWGKPVIALTRFMYTLLDFVYTPSSKEELWKLIDSKDLPCKMNENVIKYGYYLLHPNLPMIDNVPYKHVTFKIMGHSHEDYTIMTMLESHKLHSIYEYVANKFNLFSKFKKLPCTEPYKING